MGFELFEVLEGALAGTAGAIDAPLELAEGFGPAAGGLTEGEFVVGGPGVLGFECPELGFGGMEAALEPLAADEFVDEGAGFGGSGVVVLVVLVDEELEIGEFFGGKEEGSRSGGAGCPSFEADAQGGALCHREQGERGAGVGGILGAAIGGEALEEFDGAIVAGNAEGAEEGLTVIEAAGGGPGFEEHIDGVGLAGTAEGEGGFFGDLIGGGEELADKGEGGAAFQGKEGFQHLPGDGGFDIAGAGLEAEEEGAFVALHFGEGAGGVGADGGGWFGEGVDDVAEHLLAGQVGAGREGEQADAAEGAGGVLLAAPDGFQLDVDGAAQKGGRFAMAEILEGAGDGVFAPALRVALDGVFEEAFEGAEEIGEQVGGGQAGGDVGGFGGDQVDAVGERLAQSGGGVGWGSCAEAAEGFELFFDPAVGHEIILLLPRIPVRHPSEGAGLPETDWRGGKK